MILNLGKDINDNERHFEMNDKQERSPLLIGNNIGFLMNRTLLRMKLELQRGFNEKGFPLTTDHWGILQVLFIEDGVSQIELANSLAKDTPNITRMLDVMEKNGLIERRPDPDDRRKHLIFLTNKTRKMKEELFLTSSSIQGKIFKNISKNDVKKFKNMLEHMYANLE